VTLIGQDVKDIASRSRYANAFRQVQEDPEELLRTLLDLAARSPEPPVLIYTSDKYLKFVSAYRERLANRYRYIVSDADSVATVVGKDAFNRFTADQGLPAPRGIAVSAQTRFSELGSLLTFPVIVKPWLSFEWRTDAFVSRFGSIKAIHCETPDQLRQVLSRIQKLTPRVLVQDAILGPDDGHFSVVCYRSPRFGEIVRVCVNKQRIWPIHNGVGSYSRIVANAEMEEIAGSLLDALGWVGVASICFKVDRRTGTPMIHEVNGRLPQIHGALQRAGVDLPYIMYRDALALSLPESVEASSSRGYRILSMDCSALSAYRRAGELSRLQVLKKAFRVDAIAEFAVDDWKPAFGAIRRGVPALLKGLM
jgi:D-aspartate ligase